MKLPDLPKSDHKFWDRAEKHKIELIKKPKHDHYFEIKDREIVCKCGVGFFFTGRERIEDGQIIMT